MFSSRFAKNLLLEYTAKLFLLWYINNFAYFIWIWRCHTILLLAKSTFMGHPEPSKPESLNSFIALANLLSFHYHSHIIFWAEIVMPYHVLPFEQPLFQGNSHQLDAPSRPLLPMSKLKEPLPVMISQKHPLCYVAFHLEDGYIPSYLTIYNAFLACL